MNTIAVTRVINATVLIELPGGSVLTDPYFDSHWFMRFDEPFGLTAQELPPLAAIIGGHGVFDHWQPRSLNGYRHHATTAVYVANRRMARVARRAGFGQVEVLQWGEQRYANAELTVRAVPGERVMGMRTNSYVMSSGGLNVFVGTEARSLRPARAVAAFQPIDVAILPVNGIRLLGLPLVMDGPTALEAARQLGADTLVPIHHSQRPIWPILWPATGLADLTSRDQHPDVAVEILAPGERAVLGHAA